MAVTTKISEWEPLKMWNAISDCIETKNLTVYLINYIKSMLYVEHYYVFSFIEWPVLMILFIISVYTMKASEFWEKMTV